MELSWSVLNIDEEKTVAHICDRLREILRNDVHRKGFVLGLSGGIDSSVTAALCAQAVGKDRVFGLLMPERDSSRESVDHGRLLAEHLGIEFFVQDIAPALEAIGCYEWRDEAIKRVFPEYQRDWKCKLAIAGGGGAINHFNLLVQPPAGDVRKERLGLNEYLQIVASTSYKQRIRKTIEYFHADRLHYAVAGTPNRLEYDQGFFVKNGDGSADVKPIAHLYKTQVYALARYLGLPEVICNSTPSTDTYSMKQGQDEFYFSLPYREMDLALWSFNHDVPEQDLAACLGISRENAALIYKDVERKRKTTAYLHLKPVLIDEVTGI